MHDFISKWLGDKHLRPQGLDVQDKEKTLNAITSTLTSTLFDTDYRVLISTIFLSIFSSIHWKRYMKKKVNL